jgi:hypothetical protein
MVIVSALPVLRMYRMPVLPPLTAGAKTYV